MPSWSIPHLHPVTERALAAGHYSPQSRFGAADRPRAAEVAGGAIDGGRVLAEPRTPTEVAPGVPVDAARASGGALGGGLVSGGAADAAIAALGATSVGAGIGVTTGASLELEARVAGGASSGRTGDGASFTEADDASPAEERAA